MIENDEARPETTDDVEKKQERPRSVWSWGIFCCLLAIITCLALMIVPEDRLEGSQLLASLPTTYYLILIGTWLPSNFHWLANTKDSFTTTNNLEFLFFIALAFVFYGTATLFIVRLPALANFARIQTLIWICVVVVGIMLICVPFLPSHDVFVYADYGHTILTTHTNIYFTPPIAVSNSTITHLDDWSSWVAAYGPLWLGISMLVALVGGDHPLRYIFGYRALGLFAHIVNIWLVMRILRAAGRSPRAVMLGAFLYALNPLLLFESAIGAHNDIEMITLLLLGISFCLRAERRNFQHLIDYALPTMAFTLAVLIKFTCIPALVLFLVLVARKSMLSASTSKLSTTRVPLQPWLSALLKITIAALISAGLALLVYAPFWIGHSPAAILHSFTAPPSARFGENSILRASQAWIAHNGLPPASSWLYTPLKLMANHTTWKNASEIALLGGTICGAILLWRKPNTHTLISALLISLGALLIVTPWLFAWYVTWLVPLAALLIGQPGRGGRLRYALIAFAIAFSISIFFTYMANDLPLMSSEGFAQCLRVFGIPLLVFLLAFIVRWIIPSLHISWSFIVHTCSRGVYVFGHPLVAGKTRSSVEEQQNANGATDPKWLFLRLAIRQALRLSASTDRESRGGKHHEERVSCLRASGSAENAPTTGTRFSKQRSGRN